MLKILGQYLIIKSNLNIQHVLEKVNSFSGKEKLDN